ncbi:MAG: DUF3224 domain-containing protein [Pyrinomonadaceae bacterium]
METANGTFEVKMLPQADENVGDPSVGRMALDKVYKGDLEATGSGHMLAVGGGVDGSAGYVAMERVNGTLDVRRGTFALMHTGIMNRGMPSLEIAVVPDSGTGDLTGISGRMTINIENGVHFYEFRYSIDSENP